jgi:nitroreductase
METIEAIYKRRSVKHFDSEHQLSKKEEKILLEATIQSPTSFNVQHWRIVILREPDLRQQIREKYCGQAQITDASLLVLFTADTRAWAKDPRRYWINAPNDVTEDVVNAVGPFHESRGKLFQQEEAQRSIGMAMQTLMLAAQELGYESCPMIGYELEGVKKLIHLPEDYVIGPMVAIGKGTKVPWPKPGQLPLDDIVFENTL